MAKLIICPTCKQSCDFDSWNCNAGLGLAYCPKCGASQDLSGLLKMASRPEASRLQIRIDELEADVKRLELQVKDEQERNRGLVQRNRQATRIADAVTGRTANTREPNGCIGAVEALAHDFEELRRENARLKRKVRK